MRDSPSATCRELALGQQTHPGSSPSTDLDENARVGARPQRPMDATVARGIAYAGHRQSRNRSGELILEHVARVAAAVPPEAETTAWLHDMLEKTPTALEELREQGLSAVDCEALALLTRAPDESYELHALRIAHAAGAAGQRARTVKLADLDDHLKRSWADGDPPYGWARHHLRNAAARIDAPGARAAATNAA
jgi:hypothetical protein